MPLPSSLISCHYVPGLQYLSLVCIVQLTGLLTKNQRDDIEGAVIANSSRNLYYKELM